MPKATVKRKLTSRTRKGSNRRSNQARPGRQSSNRPGSPNASVVADSLFAIKLTEKPGVGLELRTKRSWDTEDNYEQMYRDLYACLKNAFKLVGVESEFDPLASGLSLTTALHYVLSSFKSNVLPKGWEVNIDKTDEEGYHFTIFRICEFDSYWHAFEIKPIVYSIKENEQLHNLFLEVLQCMWQRGFASWWGGGMGYAEYMLEEEIEDWDSRTEWDTEEESMEEYQKAVSCMHSYESGEAYEYKNLIVNAELKPPELLLIELDEFPQKSPIVDWLKSVCELLSVDAEIYGFVYEEEEELEGLKFDQQIVLAWDLEDHYSRIQGECIDSEANQIGVNYPTLYFPFTKALESFDISQLEEKRQWPSKISKVYQLHNDLLEKIKPKENGQSENRIVA